MPDLKWVFDISEGDQHLQSINIRHFKQLGPSLTHLAYLLTRKLTKYPH